MPRRTPDKGVKPFEFRTGIGGLSALGGMYRCGDPATIPPNKIHLGVNVRITPGGMISRPGLVEEYDTTVDECITGITDGEPIPQTLLLYTIGHTARWPTWFLDSGVVGEPYSFRAISRRWDEGPPTGDDPSGYSEAIRILHGAPDRTDGAPQPVLILDQTDDPLSTWGEDYPFVLNGRIVQFIHTNRVSATGAVSRQLALAELILPTNSPGHRPTGCYETSTASPGGWRNWNSDPPTQYCAARAAGDSWPWGDPVGQARVLCWVPNLLGWTAPNPDNWVVGSYVSLPERINDPLTGEAGVREVLYIILQSGTAVGYRQGLLRYDGVSWSSELTLPDHTAAAGPMRLGAQVYGPFVTTTNVDWNAGGAATVVPWARERLASGAYGVLAWNWTTPNFGPYPWAAGWPADGGIALCTNYQGFPAIIMVARTGSGSDDTTMFCVAKNGSFTPDSDWHCLSMYDDGINPPWAYPKVCRWRGNQLFTLIGQGNGAFTPPWRGTGNGHVNVYDFGVIPPPNLGTDYLTPLGTWLERIGSRFYLGGAATASEIVWDVTNPASPTRFWTSDYAGASNLNERIFKSSHGCLPIGWTPQTDPGEGVAPVP